MGFVLWGGIVIVAVLVDIMTSNFLFVWFGVGAIASLILSALGLSFKIQLLAFVLISFILLLSCYPIVKKKMKSSIKPLPTMEENYIGRVITVEEDIYMKGQVKIDGVYWNLIVDGEVKKGERVIIKSLKGNKFIGEKEL